MQPRLAGRIVVTHVDELVEDVRAVTAEDGRFPGPGGRLHLTSVPGSTDPTARRGGSACRAHGCWSPPRCVRRSAPRPVAGSSRCQ